MNKFKAVRKLYHGFLDKSVNQKEKVTERETEFLKRLKDQLEKSDFFSSESLFPLIANLRIDLESDSLLSSFVKDLAIQLGIPRKKLIEMVSLSNLCFLKNNQQIGNKRFFSK